MGLVTNRIDKPMTDNCTWATIHVINGRTLEAPIIVYFGFFTWTVFLLRQTIEYQMNDVTETSNTAETSAIHSDIMKIWLETQNYRTVIGRYMFFTTAAGSLAILGQILRSYQSTDDVDDHTVPLTNCWLWSEKLMFPVQTIIAVGHFDIDYIWGIFKTKLMKKLQSSDDNQKLQDILDQMQKRYTIGDWVVPTVAVTVSSIFISMRIPDQTALDSSYQRPFC